MITIIGRRLIIPDCDRVLGTTDEANTKIKIKLSDETVEKFFPEGVTSSAVNVTLVMETEKGDAFPSIAFVWAKDGVHEGYVNLVGRNYTGLVKARALLTYRGNDSVTVSMQTEEDYFYVTDDINGSGINEGDSEYKAWNALLADIKSETGKVTDAVDRFESYFTESEGEISKAESHYANFENPHKVTAEQVDAYTKSDVDGKVDSVGVLADTAYQMIGSHWNDDSNPHKVTAEQVGTYGMGDIDNKVATVSLIAESTSTLLDAHKNDYYNPHKVTAEQVGTYTKEKIDYLLSGKSDSGHTHENYDKHLNNVSNPHKITAEQVGAYTKEEVDLKVSSVGMLVDDVASHLNNHEINHTNPHEVTAEQVGAYDKDEVNNLLKYYDKNKENFKWTDFDYFADGENGFIAKVYDDKIVIDNAVGNEYVQLVCRGNTLGFSFTIAGYSDAILRINGEVKRYINDKKDGSVFASDTIPLTYIGDKDIFLVGNDNTWNFTDMIKQSESDNHNIVVDKELDADSDNAIANSAVAKAIGDIDTALDGILDIQNGLIGGDAV